MYFHVQIVCKHMYLYLHVCEIVFCPGSVSALQLLGAKLQSVHCVRNTSQNGEWRQAVPLSILHGFVRNVYGVSVMNVQV